MLLEAAVFLALVLALLAVVAVTALWLRRNNHGGGSQISVYASLERIRQVGELTVLSACFLAQFKVTKDGKVKWVQTERVLKGLQDLFVGGCIGPNTQFH